MRLKILKKVSPDAVVVSALAMAISGILIASRIYGDNRREKQMEIRLSVVMKTGYNLVEPTRIKNEVMAMSKKGATEMEIEEHIRKIDAVKDVEMFPGSNNNYYLVVWEYEACGVIVNAKNKVLLENGKVVTPDMSINDNNLMKVVLGCSACDSTSLRTAAQMIRALGHLSSPLQVDTLFVLDGVVQLSIMGFPPYVVIPADAYWKKNLAIAIETIERYRDELAGYRQLTCCIDSILVAKKKYEG